ncbi:MAG: hypothetical protein KGL13_05670 [Gammaproteobacteria bacterium]|nr:hypothetical protein [Gammaproteobacteria bacterium]
MIKTPSMLFVHLHKTGGQFVNRLLLRFIPGATRIGYHLPLSEAPLALRTLPVLGHVRNPWDWYVSWYAFNHAAPERNPIYRAVSAHGSLDFTKTIANLVMLADEDHQPLRMEIANQLPKNRDNNLGSGITSSIMASMQEPNRGYLSWIWRYMFQVEGKIHGVTFGRYESLRQELAGLLTQHGLLVSPAMRHEINTGAAVNASVHAEYRNYYSQPLMQLIADRERDYIEQFGYTF